MPKRAAGLTAAKVRTAKPGRYVDGDGLMLFVRSPEAKFWLLRYSHGGKRREAGLGRAGEGPNDVTLAEARQKAAEMRRLLKAGIDPLEHREAESVRQKAAAQAAAAQAMTFRAVTGLYIGAHEAGWRNEKHKDQWRNTLDAYAFPHFGDMPVGDV
ncbi:MAG TPA: Arm DNA-binding domain-containing protein, partial [Acetobacteraceae bacterium]|nr:Arm DNA-binding domain-containing protein [Acetobacteraceae bacterium]